MARLVEVGGRTLQRRRHAPELDELEVIDAEVRAWARTATPDGASSSWITLINIVILLALLVGLVLVHELGHFVLAKRAGVKVHEFGIGFPPRAAVLFRRGETTYTLNWLPIGGFVRLEGEEGESVDSRAFVNQKLGTRLRILIAGVVVNFVLAWVIFTLIAMFAQPTWKVRLGEVMPDSPAAAAGLVGGEYVETRELPVVDAAGEPTVTQPVDVHDDSGELIVAIDGQTFPVFDDMSRADSADIAQSHPSATWPSDRVETVTLTIEVGRRLDQGRRCHDADGRGDRGRSSVLSVSGRAPPTSVASPNGVVDSAVIGLERTVESSTLILRGVGNLVVSIFEGPGAIRGRRPSRHRQRHRRRARRSCRRSS